MPSTRRFVSSVARERPDIATTRTSARWHASSARTPSSVKRPSPSRVIAPSGPSSVASRSTYRQRTPELWRASDDGEAAAAEELAVAVLGAMAVARPQVPPVRARGEPMALAVVAPGAPELVARLGRPRAEDLLAVAEELDVVVAGARDFAPAQERGAAEARLEPGRQQVPGRRVHGRRHGDRFAGDVARRIDRL